MTNDFAMFISADNQSAENFLPIMQRLLDLAASGNLPIKAGLYVNNELLARVQLPAVNLVVPVGVVMSDVNVRVTPGGGFVDTIPAGLHLVIREVKMIGTNEYWRVGNDRWIAAKWEGRELAKRL